MSKKIPNELFNRGLQEREAESKRKDDFADIFEEGAAGVRDGVLHMDLFRRFFRDRTDEIAFPFFSTRITRSFRKSHSVGA